MKNGRTKSRNSKYNNVKGLVNQSKIIFAFSNPLFNAAEVMYNFKAGYCDIIRFTTECNESHLVWAG
jgi:hypothetical protein